MFTAIQHRLYSPCLSAAPEFPLDSRRKWPEAMSSRDFAPARLATGNCEPQKNSFSQKKMKEPNLEIIVIIIIIIIVTDHNM
jgi:hypothetical protein